MNAIELADELDKIWDNECRNPIISKSADMLQKQAKEIEILNQSYEILFKHRVAQEKKIEQLKTTIQAFKAGCGSKSSFAFVSPVCLEQYKSNQCMASDLNDAFVYMKGKING